METAIKEAVKQHHITLPSQSLLTEVGASNVNEDPIEKKRRLRQELLDQFRAGVQPNRNKESMVSLFTE